MTKFSKTAFLLLTFTTLMLAGCTTSPQKTVPLIKQSTEQRLAKLAQLKHWRINGKIAFIEANERNSATLLWRVNEVEKTQQLNLTSYLGINVLQLDSNKNHHLLQVDGKTYQETNLEALIFSLTGLTLPTEALSYWLKGLPYQEADVITTHPATQLPETLSSYYNNELWQVNYAHYKQIDDFSLATRFSIRKNDLLIKISVNKWSIY